MTENNGTVHTWMSWGLLKLWSWAESFGISVLANLASPFVVDKIGSLLPSRNTPDDDVERQALLAEEGALQGHEDHQRWMAKLSEFCDDVDSCDCAIEISGTTVPAHKSMLMAHSPEFRAMFTSEQYKNGEVKVTDYKHPEAMKALVRYCYQGYVDVETMDHEEWGKEIFELAHNYRIVNLKTLMEKRFIEKRLNVENVTEMAALADSYTAPKLMEACIKLITKEGDTIFDSADWKKLGEERPKLTTQLAIAAYRRVK